MAVQISTKTKSFNHSFTLWYAFLAVLSAGCTFTWDFCPYFFSLFFIQSIWHWSLDELGVRFFFFFLMGKYSWSWVIAMHASGFCSARHVSDNCKCLPFSRPMGFYVWSLYVLSLCYSSGLDFILWLRNECLCLYVPWLMKIMRWLIIL